MNISKSKTRLLTWSLFSILIPITAFSQESAEISSQRQDSVLQAKEVSPHSLYTSFGASNNMVLASTISQAQPFCFGSLTYGFNNELFASVSTFHLSAFEPFLAYHTFSLNYSHVFNSWFDISLGASRYQVASELTDTLFNNFLYSDLTLGVDWKLIYTKLSVGGLFSETSGAYFQIRNSRYFQTPQFFHEKAYISFDPYVNLLFGTLTETKTAEGTSTSISSPYHSAGSRNNSSGTTSTIFGLIEVDFGLPAGLNIGKFTIEAEPGYVLPLYSETEVPSAKGFVFLLTCTVKIF